MTVEVLRRAVWAALDGVRDPELDESIASLGFVSACSVGPAGDVHVVLRLPTFFCAANFAFLMVDDATRAVRAVPGVGRVHVELDEHFEGRAITVGVAAGSSFVETFGDEAAAELDALRRTFARKAVLAATDRAIDALAAVGYDAADLLGLTFGTAPELPEVASLRTRCADAGLPATPDTPMLVDPDRGGPVDAGELAHLVRRARVTRTGMEANGLVCRQLLHARGSGGAVPVAVQPAARAPVPQR